MTCTTASVGSLTSPCRQGCGNNAPIVRKVIADRIPVASRAQIGQTVNVKMDGVPSRDASGRIAHVVGFDLRGTHHVSVPSGSSLTLVERSYAAAARIANIFLEDATGHMPLAGLPDGRALINDVYARHYRVPMGPGVVPEPVGVDAGTLDDPSGTEFAIYFPFTPLDQATLRGAIPLSALKARGEGAFRFDIQSLTGAAVDNGMSGTLTVRLHLVYLSSLYADSGWQLEHYTQDDTSGALRHSDRRHEYIALRRYPNPFAIPDSFAEDGYQGITVQTGSDVVVAAHSSDEMLARADSLRMSALDARPGEQAAWFDPNGNLGGPLFYQPDPDAFVPLIGRARTRRAMAAGPVTYNYAARSASNTGYLHRTVLCQSERRISEITRAQFGCGCSQGEVSMLPVDEGGRPMLDDRGNVVTSLARDRSATVLIKRQTTAPSQHTVAGG